MNPPLDLADSTEVRAARLSTSTHTIDSSRSAPAPDTSLLQAVDRTRADKDATISKDRVRHLTALVSEFATHKEVLALVENYREPYSPIAKRPLPDSPVRRDLSVYRLLDKKEEQALGYQIDDGLEAYNAAEFTTTSHIIGAVAAHQTLVVCNLRFVYHLAKYYSNVTPASREQVYQWGVYGLLRAAKKYNASLGYRFTTLARNEIKDVTKKQIRKEIRQQVLGGLLVLNEHVSDDSETELIETLPDALSAPPRRRILSRYRSNSRNH